MAWKSFPLATALGTAVMAPWLSRPRGTEHLPAGACLVAANHQSFLDGPALAAVFGHATARPLHVVAYDDPFRHWFMGWFLRSGRCLPLPRADADGAETTFRRAAAHLARGDAVGVFPEGHIVPGPRLGSPRPGLAVLALETGAPVVPVGITGSERVLPPGARWPRPGRVGFRFGPPLRFAEDAVRYRSAPRDERRRMLARVLDAVHAALAELSGKQWRPRPPRDASGCADDA